MNACLKPGEWQTFDISFHRPHFTKDGQLEKPATITVLHNGVLVQDHVELLGTSLFLARGTYEAHEDKMPISLQEHGRLVRYRNIWVRELPQGPQEAPPPLPEGIIIQPDVLDDYVGQYGEGFAPTIKREGSRLYARIGNTPWLKLRAVKKDYFIGEESDVEFTFGRDEKGQVLGVRWQFCGNQPISKKTK